LVTVVPCVPVLRVVLVTVAPCVPVPLDDLVTVAVAALLVVLVLVFLETLVSFLGFAV
jgi:hypothetical protein